MKTPNNSTKTIPPGFARVLEMTEKNPPLKLEVGDGQLRVRWPEVMATIFKSTGGFGEGSTDSGTPVPLSVIASRLRLHNLEVQYVGTKEPRLPANKVSCNYDHIFIEVTELDPKVAVFPNPGFCFVSKLPVRDAGFCSRRRE